MKKNASKPYDGADCIIKVSMFIPGYEPTATDITIKNMVGNSTHTTRNPERVRKAIVDGLAKVYGKTE